MLRYLSKRVGVGLVVLVLVSFFSFALTNIAVDPATALAGEAGSAADIQVLREAYGLDRPIAERYFIWAGHTVRGDLGTSYRQRRPVLDMVVERLPVTLTLGLSSILIAIAIAVPFGVLGAIRRGSWIDRLGLVFSLVGQAMPTMWLSLLLMQYFALALGWFPISGSAGLSSFVLPALTLGIGSAPVISGLIRTGMINVLNADYVRMARAKGLRRTSILWKHALRNAVVPAVSVAAVQFGHLLGGSIVVETIYAMQGVGYLAWSSLAQGDFLVVQAIILLTSVFYVVLVILSDFVNGWINPQLRAA